MCQFPAAVMEEQHIIGAPIFMILLANSKVPKFVDPTCLLERQKSLGNVRKKKYF
jgi:hypothetical protein